MFGCLRTFDVSENLGKDFADPSFRAWSRGRELKNQRRRRVEKVRLPGKRVEDDRFVVQQTDTNVLCD